MAFLLILIYIVFVIIRPQEYLQSLENIPVLLYLIVLTMGVWFLTVKKDFSIPQPILVTGFFAAVVISIMLSGWMGGGWWAFQQFFPVWILFIMMSMTITTLPKIRLTMDVIAYSGLVVAIHSIEQYHFGVSWTGLELATDIDGRIRYLGIFNDPNDLGVLFVTTLPFIGSWQSRARNGLMRTLSFILLGVMIYAIYLTDSRGAMLASLLILAMHFSTVYGRVKTAIAGGVAMVILSAVKSRLEKLDASEKSAFERIEAWYQGIQMLKSNPLFGVGFGQFQEHHERTAHNSFVLVFAETGLIGFFFWLGLVLISFYLLIQVSNIDDEEALQDSDEDKADLWQEYKKTGWLLLMSLSGYVVGAFFLSRSYDTYFYIIFGLIAGYCLGAQRAFSWIPKIRVMDRVDKFAFATLGGVVFAYFLVRLLLVMGG